MRNIVYKVAKNKITELELSDNTKSNLINTLALVQGLGVEDPDNLFDALEKFRKSSDFKLSTINNYYSNISSLIKKNIIETPNNYQDLQDYLYHERIEAKKNITTVPTETQQEHYMDLGELQNRVKLMPISTKKLLLSMYINIPPVRLDYADVKIVETDSGVVEEKQNYYIRKSNTIVLQDYKTIKAHGVIHYKLPLELKHLIASTLKQEPREYLFSNKKGEPYKKNTFAKYLNSTLLHVMEKPLTILDIRHIYASKYTIKTHTFKEVKEVARRMLHSVETKVLQYEKDYEKKPK